MTAGAAKPSLILAVHGSARGPGASAPARAAAAQLMTTGGFEEVVVAALKEPPGVSATLQSIQGRPVWVVPFFLAEGWFTGMVLPRELDAAGVDYEIFRPLGASPRIVDLVLERAQTCPHEPARTALVVIGHGTPRAETSCLTARDVVKAIVARGDYAEAAAVFTDDEPPLASLGDLTSTPHVVAVPMFAGAGFHAAALASEIALGPGRRLDIAPPVGTSPLVPDAILALLP